MAATAVAECLALLLRQNMFSVCDRTCGGDSVVVLGKHMSGLMQIWVCRGEKVPWQLPLCQSMFSQGALLMMTPRTVCLVSTAVEHLLLRRRCPHMLSCLGQCVGLRVHCCMGSKPNLQRACPGVVLSLVHHWLFRQGVLHQMPCGFPASAA